MLNILNFCTALLCMKFSTFQKSNLVLQAINGIESYLGYSQMFIFIKDVMEKSEMLVIIILSALRTGEAFCKVCWHKQSIHAWKHSFSCCVWKLRQLLEELLKLSINVCKAILSVEIPSKQSSCAIHLGRFLKTHRSIWGLYLLQCLKNSFLLPADFLICPCQDSAVLTMMHFSLKSIIPTKGNIK